MSARDKARAQYIQLERIAAFREEMSALEVDIPFIADDLAYQAFVLRQAATNLDNRFHFSIGAEKLA